MPTHGPLLPELSKPLKAGEFELKNRVVLAPLTRARSGEDRVPNATNVEYYRQRACAGLVITEATTVSPMANGWADSPGIYTPEQVAGWKNVVDAVHAEGGTIACQLWYIGRAGHSTYMPDGGPVVSASDVPIDPKHDGVWGADFKKHPHETPSPLTLEQIETLIEEYGVAAANAKEAGFDGIEVHAGNGYLLDQFLQSSTNKRDDKYGGDFDGRFTLLKEIIEKCVEKAFPTSRIGVRISPNGVFNGMGSADNHDAFVHYAKRLQKMNLAYLSVMDGLGFGYHDVSPVVDLPCLRKEAGYTNALFGNVGYTGESANAAIEAGDADAIIFGRLFIANPDLPYRLTNGWELAESDASKWYTAGEESRKTPEIGYADYPAYEVK